MAIKAKDLGLVTAIVRTNFLAIVRTLLASIMIVELVGKAKVYSNGSVAADWNLRSFTDKMHNLAGMKFKKIS